MRIVRTHGISRAAHDYYLSQHTLVKYCWCVPRSFPRSAGVGVVAICERDLEAAAVTAAAAAAGIGGGAVQRDRANAVAEQLLAFGLRQEDRRDWPGPRRQATHGELKCHQSRAAQR